MIENVSQNITILSVNAGSSSIKLRLFEVGPSDHSYSDVLTASVTGVGQPSASLHIRVLLDDDKSSRLPQVSQREAITRLLHEVAGSLTGRTISAIGHRIVHGGPHYKQPQRLDSKIERDLEALAIFDPEHIPVALLLVDILRQRYPDTPQIACFDTAFFADMPRVAQILPIPRKYESKGVRRYGFHGLSYTYLLSAFRDLAGDAAANGRIIFAHLGSGVSLAAVKNGLPIDTTMGFSPTSGVLMSSRSGDLDPGIIGFLHKEIGMTVDDYGHMVNFESGLLGISELSADMYTLLQHEATNDQAADAVALFVYQVKKAIGSLSATLGGLDSLVFSGGIGEKSATLRERICDELGYLGIELEADRNNQHADLISAPTSRVGCHVIPTNEALVIAKQVYELIRKDV